MNCPICKCGITSDSIHFPSSEHEILFVIAREINPNWEISEGMCPTCKKILTKPVGLLTLPEKAPQRSNDSRFFRYHLNRLEHKQWNCPVRELQRYEQNQIMAEVSELALEEGYEGWMIFDADGVLASRHLGASKAA